MEMLSNRRGKKGDKIIMTVHNNMFPNRKKPGIKKNMFLFLISPNGFWFAQSEISLGSASSRMGVSFKLAETPRSMSTNWAVSSSDLGAVSNGRGVRRAARHRLLANGKGFPGGFYSCSFLKGFEIILGIFLFSLGFIFGFGFLRVS